MSITKRRYNLYMLRAAYDARNDAIYREIRAIEEGNAYPPSDDESVFLEILGALEKE